VFSLPPLFTAMLQELCAVADSVRKRLEIAVVAASADECSSVQMYQLCVAVCLIALGVALAQQCSRAAFGRIFVIESSQDAAELSNAAACENAVITASWLGKVPISSTIAVGVNTTLTINGSDLTAAIDGVGRQQLFRVQGTLSLHRITLTRGFADGNGGAVLGSSSSRVCLTSCTLSECAATTGGALYSDQGFLRVTNTSFTSNTAADAAGAIYTSGILQVNTVRPSNMHACACKCM
jgi:hypothetical protein